ncbi:MAG: hypothetical protein CMB99_08660 [Flavobacteriaceae bacterium]|nr:hypothetical protein [Flavobacteriaceae bacterium]|tara:strand:- start:15375 stop:16091 length:717 start_codon:yes stop_codon:yes gene_type:complete
MIKRYLSSILFAALITVVYGQQKSTNSNIVMEPLAMEMNTMVLSNSINNGFNVLRESSFGIDGPHLNYPLSFTKEQLTCRSERGGSLAISDNGTPYQLFDDLVLYTPPQDFIGTDIVHYQLKTKSGVIKNGLIKVQVKEKPKTRNILVQQVLKSSSFSFNIFPNPAVERITILINQEMNAESEIALFDLTGKLLMSKNIRLQKGSNEVPISSKLQSGMYFLSVKNDIHKTIKQLVISN